jgi:hypothetical protein
MEKEIWKNILGYEDIYEISSFGNIRSVDRIILNKGKYPFFKKGKTINKRISTSNYYIVTLCKNGAVKTFEVHKLIAIAFLNHIPNGYNTVVDHIDNNSLNNNLNNLQIITQRKNTSKDKANKTSKYTGVYFRKSTGKYESQIMINKKIKHLGTFSNEIDASIAYEKQLDLIEKAKPLIS